MVEALPAEGGCIIAHDGALASYIRNMVFDLRGSQTARKVKIVVVRHWGDCNHLMGRTGHVVVDHAFAENVSPEIAARVDELVRGIRLVSAVA